MEEAAEPGRARLPAAKMTLVPPLALGDVPWPLLSSQAPLWNWVP